MSESGVKEELLKNPIDYGQKIDGILDGLKAGKDTQGFEKQLIDNFFALNSENKVGYFRKFDESIRMKILEAMSIGVPFVTTTVGAEGIPVTDGVDSVIADTPEAYVSGIQKLEDAETRKMMVENGRKLLLSNYSFEKFKTDRIEIVKALLS